MHHHLGVRDLPGPNDRQRLSGMRRVDDERAAAVVMLDDRDRRPDVHRRRREIDAAVRLARLDRPVHFDAVA